MTPRRLAFGDYRFEPDTGQLWRGGDEIGLTPRVASLLLVLTERAPEVVTKQQLIARVWDGQPVGDDALTSCVQHLRRALGDDPRRPALIETRHGRGYRLMLPAKPEAATTAAPVRREKASIAVLPFQNLSGDNSQQYLVDGLVEDIIGALSRTRWLFVIGRNSSFTYRAPDIDVNRVGRELDVRYVLTGTLRKSAKQVRVSGQLVEAATGIHLWADSFSGTAKDVFDLQAQMTARLIGVLLPRMDLAEVERALRKPTEQLDAYDLYLRGRGSTLLHTRQGNEAALALFRQAIELDPSFAAAHGRAAVCFAARVGHGWDPLQPADIAEAERLARRAWELDPSDPIAVGMAGIAMALAVRDLDTGAAYLERALALNPNVPIHWLNRGWIDLWLGRGDYAMEAFERALHLSPMDPDVFIMETGIAHAHFFAGCYRLAQQWAQKALVKKPDWKSALRIVAAAAALDGRPTEARCACNRLMELHPGFRLSRLSQVLGPYRHPERLARGLRCAGIPE